MINQGQRFARVAETGSKVVQLSQTRARLAEEHFLTRLQKAHSDYLAALLTRSRWPGGAWTAWSDYLMDWAQRSLLFWDTMRQRGNIYLAHERAGKPPVLHFQYEMVLDARQFPRPVNYALLRILPPAGRSIDPKRRPYVVLDPRAGHGPGIGGFKDDSQVGVALRQGHPVYFIIFFPEPEPGQTLLDVTAAEDQFLSKVRELHPQSPKPVLVGNCQGGWAAMMLAGSNPENTGPIVINGAPMSYWGGAWSQGEGDNPMRYAAGLLGGTWLASLAADLGNGIFDGAWLVQNFESLNPANTFWDKYYHVFAHVDTEPPRFLEFERWWGGMYLMNREEIEWITQNLFVGNKLWSGQVHGQTGVPFDLRAIRSPIILFASLGDNITPPQQAFNWVADVYGSTEEIKANGQVIVGLLHQEVGHLGIFVSGRVAKKEHAQIVSVLQSIEALAPGLYGMHIRERNRGNGTEYEVEFVEHRLEEIAGRLNRFKRADEQPFLAVEELAEFNQRAYELFFQPVVQSLVTEWTAQLTRMFHPLRVQHWAFSDLNPWLAALAPLAERAKAERRPLGPDAPLRQFERLGAEVISACLDYFREVRDGTSEALFYQIYGNLFALYLADKREAEERQPALEVRELPVVRAAMANLTQGGYPEALARVLALVGRSEGPFALEQLHLKQLLAQEYAHLLPQLTREQQRRIRGQQEIIVRYEPERALETLPELLRRAADRARLQTFAARLRTDPRLAQLQLSPKQVATLKQIRKVLGPQTRTARGPARRHFKAQPALVVQRA